MLLDVTAPVTHLPRENPELVLTIRHTADGLGAGSGCRQS